MSLSMGLRLQRAMLALMHAYFVGCNPRYLIGSAKQNSLDIEFTQPRILEKRWLKQIAL
jgi:hypothetical protein